MKLKSCSGRLLVVDTDSADRSLHSSFPHEGKLKVYPERLRSVAYHFLKYCSHYYGMYSSCETVAMVQPAGPGECRLDESTAPGLARALIELI